MKNRFAVRPLIAVVASSTLLLAGSTLLDGAPAKAERRAGAKAAVTLAQPTPASEAIVQDLIVLDAAARSALASELERWVTRHPHELVEVIADLAEKQPLPLPPTYLLSIAWAETRGKILAVSPAGAAGLAQATPSAYLSEGYDGKLYVTTDYLMGTRAFIMKKPLGDALSISAPLLKSNTAATRKRAKALTARAIELRGEGIDELEALRPVANETFFRRIAEGEAHNLATLQELERLIDRGAPAAAVKSYRARVQRDYTYLRNMQRDRWDRYARDLARQRDVLLERKFGQKPSTVILTRPYEAGEYLGVALDARFSPTKMAEFLASHLGTKQAQAREIGVDDDGLAAWTAALYNGGAVNIKRMQAGLIGTLIETQKYMRAVPERQQRLERSIG
ncbi:MAG TPA: hypothetical protein VMS98_11635 [Thermoanaerobaculia bacterium]|nr:hypothetical protein [Thermoanaerobaculia bacterium]